MTPTRIYHAAAELAEPPYQAVRGYSWKKFRADLAAGMTVCAIELPQAMAYAIIAGVPPQYGLYASIIHGTVCALLSSSEHLQSGPTNTQSLLVASTIAAISGVSPEQYLQLVFLLALLKGCVQIAFAMAGLGSVIRYVSRAVITGITAGAGILIIANQLPAFLGVPPGGRHPFLPSILGTLWNTLQQLPSTNMRALSLGILTVVLMLLGRVVPKRIPMSLIAVVICAAGVWLLNWSGTVGLVPEIPRSLPRPIFPFVNFELAERLIGGALALAMLGMVEAVAISKTIASHSGERVDANRECFSQGMQNLIGAFLQAIPGSASFTRSALNYQSGGQTRFSALFNAGAILAVMLLFADAARFIPLACLAGILFVIAFGLIDFRHIVRLSKVSREDFIVCLITLSATLLAPLQYAIFIGVFLNLALYIRQSSKLHLAEMVQDKEGRFFEHPLRDRSGGKGVSLIQVEGSLFFGVADEFQDRLRDLLRSDVRVVVFRLKRTHSIDSTILHELDRFVREMQSRDRYVILCGVRYELLQTLRSYGLIDLIGRENVFETGHGVFASVKKALERAKKLVGSSIDASSIDLSDDEFEPFVYQI